MGKLPPCLPTLGVLSGAKITFIIRSELIVDFASIRRGSEKDGEEQLVNVMQFSVFIILAVLCTQDRK